MNPTTLREHRCGRHHLLSRWIVLCVVASGSFPAALAQEAVPLVEAIPEDSTITRLIFDTLQDDPPRTVDEQLKSVRILLNIDKDAQALASLKAIAAMPLSGDELRRLHSHFGSVFFLELAADQRVADVAQELLNRIFEAVRATTEAPAALADRISQLGTGDPERIRVARDSLRSAGDWGVVALLQAIASRDTTFAARAHLQAALLELAAIHPEPVLAAARSSNVELSQVALDALVAMNRDDETTTRALPRLIGRNAANALGGDTSPSWSGGTADRGELRRRMNVEIRRLWKRAKSRDDTTVLWFWDRESGAPVPREMTGQIADFVVASQIAEDWMAIDPHAEEAQELYWCSVLAALQLSNGLDRVIPDGDERQIAVASPPHRMGRVLNLALRERIEAAAVAACQILALQGDPSALAGDSPLMRAVRDPNARIRFAALLASTQLAPQPTLTGAGNLWHEALRILATRGERRVMIVDPNGQRAARVASLANQAGWTATVTRESRECIRLLRQSPDFEFVVIHDDLSTPPWSELVQQLQFDHLTAALPITILFNVDHPRRETIPLAVDQFPVPVDATTWKSLENRAFPAGTPMASVFQRLERARQIRPWALRVAENRAWQPVHELESIDPSFFPRD